MLSGIKAPAVAALLTVSLQPIGLFHKPKPESKAEGGYLVVDGKTAPEPKPGAGLSCVTVFTNVKTRATTFRCTDEKGKRWEFVVTPLDDPEKK